mmetsp:Transcript_11848/g.23602  ORF Transcript_11848/g.23602 Transcript_11848/m.23602 type:complete len:121 (-) Transcript_11848:384-746(-)
MNLGRTPPTFTPGSYEQSHFGKRHRSGSISGRLRSTSSLLNAGVINEREKALLKDGLIANDVGVQEALDLYEEGDPSRLQSLLKGGDLEAAPVDLLEGLDFTFLGLAPDLASLPPPSQRL